MHNKLMTFNYDALIIGGDFNFVFNLDRDTSGGNRYTNFNARDWCIEIMPGFDLVDVWREKNPKHFTWTSNITRDIHCRLDVFLISRNLLHSVTALLF